MKHWTIDQVAWDRFDPSKVDPEVVPLIKAAAMVERNGDDYAAYLKGVFHDDQPFKDAADHWASEENQHGDALGRWASLADPSFDYMASFAKYRDGYKIDVKADASIRGSRTGELIARCMVETGTSSYYTALGEATDEPVLKDICRLIAADEYRHFKLFYDHMKRYLARENLSFPQRLRVALGRVGETEDDELAFAFHCSNDPPGLAYAHDRCSAAYMGRAMSYYRYPHIQRSMAMIFKSVGLDPRGRLAGVAANGFWRMIQWRQKKFRQVLARTQQAPALSQAA